MPFPEFIAWRKYLYFVVTLGCLGLLVGCINSKNQVPDWINTLPENQTAAVGSASYEIFGEAKARENAVMKAISALALQKGGTVDIEGQISNSQTVNWTNGGESVTDHSVVETRAVVRGQDIPVKGKIKAYWKDTTARRVWVLLVEED